MDTLAGMSWSKRSGRALLIVAVIELVVAAAFVVVAVTVPATRVGLLVAAVVFVVTGVLLIVLARKGSAGAGEAERLRAGGMDGTAVITSITQTGVHMNQQPQVEMQLEVTVPGRSPYAVAMKQYVPLILIGRVTSGAPLPVKVDPSNPQNLVIDWQGVGATPAAPGAAPGGVVVGKDVAATPKLVAEGSAAGMLPSESELDYKRNRLRLFGKPGTAVVQSAQDAGQTLGRYRLFVVDLVVTIEGQSRDIPASAAAVPAEHAEKVVAGTVVPVRVDAKNADDMTLLWEEAGPPSA